MKKRVIISFVLITITMLLITGACAQEFRSLIEYYQSLEVSCSSNHDCVVQNVENCCGYYPKCVHKNAELKPEIVDELCLKMDVDCGSKFLIAYCNCQGESSTDKKCVGHFGRPEISCGDGNCFENETLEDNPQFCAQDCGIEIEEEIEEVETQEVNETQEPEETEPPVTETTEEVPPTTTNTTTEGTGKTSTVVWIIIIIVIIAVVAGGIVFWQLKVLKNKKKKLLKDPPQPASTPPVISNL
jgi:hypothetical protein